MRRDQGCSGLVEKISHVRYSAGMSPQKCAHCGREIPQRADPRGRPARFCSGACRAAASRKRRAERAAAALEEARTQSMIDLNPPPAWDERCREAAEVLDELAEKAAAGMLFGDERRALDAARRAVRASHQSTSHVRKGSKKKKKRRR